MKIACITPDNKRDYLCENILEGIHELGHELIISDPGNGFVKRALYDNEFREAADQSDAMLVFFGKQRNNRPPRRYFLEQVNLPKSRIAYIDGSEWSCTGWEGPEQASASLSDNSKRRGEPWIDEEMIHQCGHYFKRETYKQDLERGIIPLPLGLSNKHLVDSQNVKDIDIFCSFGHTKTGLRKEAIEIAQHFKNTTNFNVVVRNDLSPKEYKDHLKRAKIVIDAFGGGDTCDRFWEGIGAKACVVYQRYNIEFPNPFVDWEHAVSYTSANELSENLTKLLQSNKITTIAESGYQHALTFHTVKQRADIICSKLIKSI